MFRYSTKDETFTRLGQQPIVWPGDTNLQARTHACAHASVHRIRIRIAWHGTVQRGMTRRGAARRSAAWHGIYASHALHALHTSHACTHECMNRPPAHQHARTHAHTVAEWRIECAADRSDVADDWRVQSVQDLHRCTQGRPANLVTALAMKTPPPPPRKKKGGGGGGGGGRREEGGREGWMKGTKEGRRQGRREGGKGGRREGRKPRKDI